ncbi:MAG: response regulator transcription factor [Actinomycetota bacterium]|nr:response regulator transcription factor [Actinomycetota bacterium]
MAEINVVIADDHTIVRQGLKRLLQEADMNVVGETSSGLETVKLVAEVQPDVVVMDIEMPELDGIAATRQIKKENPRVNVVILTMHESEDYLFEAIKAGAIGYILKDQAADELVETIRAAAMGLSQLEPRMAGLILREFSEIETKKDRQSRLFATLTNREKEILQYVAQAMSNKEIAKVLFISDKTVRNHLGNIFEKLHINDRTAAAIIAIRHGLA